MEEVVELDSIGELDDLDQIEDLDDFVVDAENPTFEDLTDDSGISAVSPPISTQLPALQARVSPPRS